MAVERGGGRGRPPRGKGAWSSSGGKGGKSRGRQGDAGAATRQVDPTYAKALLWSWLQKTQRAARPAEWVSLEHARRGRGHGCTAWVWADDDWAAFEGAGWHQSRPEAVAAAYVAAVEGLAVPVPQEYALSEEAAARQKARGAEERRKAQIAEQRAQVVAAAFRDFEADVLQALFPGANDDPDGFRTPRESEEEQMPSPVPARLTLPPAVEARHGEERGNKSVQQLKQLVKREANLLQGPTILESQRSAAGGTVYVSVCALLFDRAVAIMGTAWGMKRGAVKAAAAAAALARIDTSAPLPSRDEAGSQAAAVVEIRRLQQMQPFKVWAFEGAQPNDQLRWFCALWGQVPFQGGLRDFWGEGGAGEKGLAVAGACGEAAGQLSRLLGSGDCVKWLKAMARVNMDIEEVPQAFAKGLADSEGDGGLQDYEERLRRWLAARRKSDDPTEEPPSLEDGPAPTVPQLYEPEPEDGPLEKAKAERGVPKLPVRDLRAPLDEVLGDCACIVVSGGTGSGKSTQIPQYLVDDFKVDAPSPTANAESPGGDDVSSAWSGPARVVVTEPRRIAAVSLAERVAWERDEPVGRSVGYSVRGDSKMPRSRDGGTIEFCTVGILLRRLQRDPRLRQVSHVVVDEVHERDLMTDFLLILLKELLCVRNDLRVILMSATLDVRTFTTYLWSCPCMEIPTGPRYEVEEVHLEDAAFSERWAAGFAHQLLAREEEARRAAEEAREAEAAEADEEADGDAVDDNAAYRTSTGVWWGSAENDETYIDLLARLVAYLSEGPALVDDEGLPGSVLCFLPGWAEIKTCQDRLQELDRGRQQLWVLPLHSTLPKAEQQLIFKHPPEGKTKVILGTNIAESSVTIDDVLVVVDAGLMREVSYDPVRRLSTLETVWVSQSSAIQRTGRAGRVRRGRCYRLYSRTQLEQAPWRTTPEMQRCELSSTCLQALALKREVRDFLARAPDPPTRAAVETALEELLQLGAICPEADSETPLSTSVNDEPEAGEASERARRPGALREQMMPLGEALSRMTLSPMLGRMLIMGTLFGATDEACLLAAVISATRRIFACPPGRKKESLACTRGFSFTSDTLAAYIACKDYEGWREARSEPYADRWAGDLFLVPKRMKQLLAARDMHWEELKRVGLARQQREDWWSSNGHGGKGGYGSWWNSSWDGAEEHLEAWEEDGATGPVDPGGGQDKAEAVGDSGEPPSGDESLELVKALLVAAYPQNLALRRRVGMAKHNTPTGLEAIIAPQSVNAPPKAKPTALSAPSGEGKQPSWWSYGQMHISSRQGFLRSTTLIDPYHVALFGGLAATEDDSGALRDIDGWIELRGPRQSLRCFAQMRNAVSRCIHLRALDPGSPLPTTSQEVLKELKALLGTATLRQERLASLLPENLVQPVEKPPPPSERRDGYGGRAAGSDRRRNGGQMGEAATGSWAYGARNGGGGGSWAAGSWDRGGWWGEGPSGGRKGGKGSKVAGGKSHVGWAGADATWGEGEWAACEWAASAWDVGDWDGAGTGGAGIWDAGAFWEGDSTGYGDWAGASFEFGGPGAGGRGGHRGKGARGKDGRDRWSTKAPA